MCLAIPGKILERWDEPGGLAVGKVQFGSVARDVCLAYTPEAGPGDYVIVHVGFAIQRLDEAAAHRTLATLEAAEAAEAAAAGTAGEQAEAGEDATPGEDAEDDHALR